MITEHQKSKKTNLLYQSIKNFKDNDAIVFENDNPSPKEHLTTLLTNKYNRMFCQYDLKYFFAYNKVAGDQYTFTKLSHADENLIIKDKPIFYLSKSYFVYGPIRNVRRKKNKIFIKCDFEDGDREEYSVSEEDYLYFIEINI